MGNSYTRNDTSNNIADGNIINASDLDGEFDAIESAMGTSGHTHDGTTGEGGPITKLGPVQDLVVSASAVTPKTDNTLDLGSSSLEFKDGFFDGTVNADGLTVVGAADVTGDLDVDNININGNTISSTDTNGNITLAPDGTGVVALSSTDLTFGDNDKAIFGAGSDLQIYHDGSNSIVYEGGTGTLKLATAGGSVDIVKGSDSSETMAKFNINGAAELYHDNAKKLETTATGADITGVLTADGLTVDGTATITNTASTNTLTLTGNTGSVAGLRLAAEENHAVILGVNEGNNFGGVKLQTNSNGTLVDRFNIASNGDISFYADNGTTQGLFWDASTQSLGLGTTSPGGTPLYVKGQTNDNVMIVEATGTAANYIFDVRDDGTSKFRVGPSGNVGIGESSPTRNLVIKDTDGQVDIGLVTSNTGVSAVMFADTDDSNIGRIQYLHSTNDLTFTTNDSEAVRITSGGNVGIGTVSPSVALDVQTTSDDAFYVTGGRSVFTTATNSNGVVINGIGTPANYYFDIRDDGASGILRVTGDGKVGIGTDSPAQLLHVNSTGNVAAAQIQGASHTAKISTDGAGTIFGTTTNGYMLLATNNAERMRLDASGNLLVGTTTVGGNGFTFETNGFATFARASGAAQSMIGFKNGGSFVGEIRTSTTATAYLTSSDHRLKENVTADWDATTRLKQLNPVRFNFIADADTTVDGFLAHEVQDIVPEAITGTHNEVDDEGNPVYQGIDQSKLVPLLVKTIQELEARIAALEAN
jgi:cytoskeletal protein CcmA (bactofilin family)